MKFVDYVASNTTAKWLQKLGEYTDERGRVYDLVIRPGGTAVSIFPHRGTDVFGEVYRVDLSDPYAIYAALLGLVRSHHEDIDNPYELEPEDGGGMSYEDTPA